MQLLCLLTARTPVFSQPGLVFAGALPKRHLPQSRALLFQAELVARFCVFCVLS